MKTKTLLIVLVTLLIAGAGGVGLYRIGKSDGMKMTSLATQGAGGGVAASASKKPLYWQDPMAPGKRFDKPGKSPFMDMQLVPVYAGEPGDEGNVSVSPRMQQNLGIRTAVVTRASLATNLSAVGSVAYNERDVALVQARSSGFVERLYVRATLDPVKKGQPLLDLYVPDWIAAQEEYLAARRMQGGGIEGLTGAARQRMLLAGMDENQVRLVESSGKVHPRMTIAAPIDGVIAELAARQGMTVTAGAPLFRINGLASVWVNAEVPENSAAMVRPGALVEARTPALPGTILKGKVSAILPEVNAATRTIKARIELENPGGSLVPGMFATLRFAGGTGKTTLMVPSEALIQTGTRSVVMVALGDGKFNAVDVEAGAEAAGQTEILKGLEAGQKVVVSGQFLIDSEASLRGTAVRMSDAPAPKERTQAVPVHHGVGKIEQISDGEVTISHGAIATLHWDAMTMAFEVPSGGLPAKIAVGDTVSFDFKQEKDGTFVIVAIAPAAHVMPGKPAGASK